jgi:SEC-C motif
VLKGNDPIGKNRADYLLRRREIIVEQKSLDVDPVPWPQNYANKLMAQGRLIAFGTVSTSMLSEELQREVLLDLAKNLDAVVAKADHQTEDTRGIFSIPDALGVLVILNEKAGMLDPRVIHYDLANVFQKKTADGSLRYPSNDGVILIPEAPAISTPHGRRIHLMRFTSPHCRANERFLRFSDALFKAWSKFNDVPLIIGRCAPWAGTLRNAQCPCGSGKRFKHCHGRV